MKKVEQQISELTENIQKIPFVSKKAHSGI